MEGMIDNIEWYINEYIIITDSACMNYEYVYKAKYIYDIDLIFLAWCFTSWPVLVPPAQLQSLSGWMRALLSTRHTRGRNHQNSRLHFEIGTEVP